LEAVSIQPSAVSLAPSVAARATIVVVKLVEAQYENGVLRPMERLGLRSGERVNLMVVRRPDPRRWDLARLSKTSNQEDLALSEQGLEDWANSLDETEHH
jgi:predicted DNA-binding antitoxin AbrB/MazE fold protein